MPTQAISLNALIARFGGQLFGDGAVLVSQIAPLASAKKGQIAFLSNPKLRHELENTQASALIIAPQFADFADFADISHIPRIVTPNPYAYYAKVAALLNPLHHSFSGVHSSAMIESDLPESSNIGAKVVIGKNVVLGENVTIYAGCVIGDNVKVGAECVLYPNIVVYQGCELGARVIIQAGAIIGSDGFGFANEAGRWLKIPQMGRVIIGDDVEIGANTTIDRGALEDTTICNGAKLDNQIQIAHNISIGENTAIAGCVGIAGSTKIGANCTIGGAAMIVGHLEIADRVNIAGGTVVAKSIKEAGLYAGVFPMEKQEDWAKSAVHVKRLQKLVDRVGRLEKAVEKKLEENN